VCTTNSQEVEWGDAVPLELTLVSNKKTKVFELRHIVVTLKSATSKRTKSLRIMREEKRVKKRREEKERKREGEKKREKLKIICIGAAIVNLVHEKGKRRKR
jgi:hypothetical protein